MNLLPHLLARKETLSKELSHIEGLINCYDESKSESKPALNGVHHIKRRTGVTKNAIAQAHALCGSSGAATTAIIADALRKQGHHIKDNLTVSSILSKSGEFISTQEGWVPKR